MSPPNSKTRNAKLRWAPKPGGTLVEKAGAPAPPSEPCVVGQGQAQKSRSSPRDADAADAGPGSEKDASSLLVM